MVCFSGRVGVFTTALTCDLRHHQRTRSASLSLPSHTLTHTHTYTRRAAGQYALIFLNHAWLLWYRSVAFPASSPQRRQCSGVCPAHHESPSLSLSVSLLSWILWTTRQDKHFVTAAHSAWHIIILKKDTIQKQLSDVHNTLHCNRLSHDDKAATAMGGCRRLVHVLTARRELSHGVGTTRPLGSATGFFSALHDKNKTAKKRER